MPPLFRLHLLATLLILGCPSSLFSLSAQELLLTEVGLDEENRPIVRFTPDPGHYYILYRGDDVNQVVVPMDVVMGDRADAVRDPEPATFEARFYRVQQVSILAPLDLDEDGMDDVYELERAPLLHPLRSLDAFEDLDGDYRTNLEEYRLGTDPFLSDIRAPRVTPTVSATSSTTLQLTGTAMPGGYVRVEGGAAVSTNSVGANGTFSVDLALTPNRLNRLLVSTVDPNGSTSIGEPIEVLQDSQPPTLFLDFPTNSMVISTSEVTVAGRVGDSLSGYQGLAVWVHSSPSEGPPPLAATSFPADSPLRATVDVGIGPNGTYERGPVPLSEGDNTLTVVTTDALGNRTLRQATVVRRVPEGPHLAVLSGDRQMTNALRRLEQPLVIQARQADGAPLAQAVVVFEITRSDGRLLPVTPEDLVADWTTQPNANTNGAMRLELRTNASGEARAWWTLGSDAGCANNRVCVTGVGLNAAVYLCASAFGHPARQINIGSGNHQKAEANALTPEPLRAWVSDGLNPAAGIPVTFRIIQGGGRLVPGGRDGTPQAARDGSGREALGRRVMAEPVEDNEPIEMTVLTGVTGHASIGFIAGPSGGQNLIEASFPGQFGLPATFTVYGLTRDLTRPGIFTGLVLDNTSCPVGHAYCELEVANYRVGTFTDLQGRFRFENVPGGMGHLHVNGATATNLFNLAIPTNSFPSLHYSVVTVANAENALPAPVLLPRLNPRNAHVYAGTNDLVLTVEGMDGLKMTIAANSMKHPDGTRVTPDRPAVVSLDQVHHDDVPMPMPDGVAPPFAWTLQPGGATFDPPVRVEYPNMSGLAPGSIAYFLSFNHDTERFEIVSSGSVTEDGSTIVTDPDSGLTLAGWGCNCPPYSVTANCNNCLSVIPPEQPALNIVEVGNTATFRIKTPTKPGILSWHIVGVSASHQGNSFPIQGGEVEFDVITTEIGAFTLELKWSATEDEGGNSDRCEIYEDYYSVSEAMLTFRYKTFVPCDLMKACIFENYPFLGMEGCPPAYISHDYYTGDGSDRAFSYEAEAGRTFSECLLVFGGKRQAIENEEKRQVESHGYDASQVEALGGPSCNTLCGYRVKTGEVPRCVGTGPGFQDFFRLDDTVPDDNYLEFGLNFYMSAGPGCVPAVGPFRIDVCATLWMRQYRERGFLGTLELKAKGTHDGFPWHEMYIRPEGGDALSMHQYSGCGKDLISLALGCDSGFDTVNFTYPESDEWLSLSPLSFLESIIPRGLHAVQPRVANRLNNDWLLSFNGQLSTPRKGGAYEIANVSAIDLFGVEGPGTSPDFVGDIPARLTGVNSSSGSNRYAFSDYIYLRQGETTYINELTYTDTPPRQAERMEILAPSRTLRIGTTNQLQVTAWYADGSTNDVTRRSEWTTYRLSNPRLARITLDGELIPLATGILYVTAINESATTVVGLNITSRDDEFINLIGRILLPNGQPAAGVELRITGLVENTEIITDSQGEFVVENLPTGVANVTLHGWLADPAGGGWWLAVRDIILESGVDYDLKDQTLSRLVLADSNLLAAGRSHSLALRKDGTLWAWGGNADGQLGDGTRVDRQTPTGIIQERRWRSVVAGSQHTLGLMDDGTLWAWGLNWNGRLGDGTTTSRLTPTAIMPDDRWRSVSAGGMHTVALRVDGTLWSWGFNGEGQLGDGTIVDKFVPTPVLPVERWQAVASGRLHTAALQADGSLWAWGYNAHGQLGDGTTIRRASPTAIQPQDRWRAVALGDTHTVALHLDGTLWTWGSNSHGQLGDGTLSTRSNPTQIQPEERWKAVAVVHNHTVALRADGTLWAWGWNGFGQLGDGTRTDRNLPTVIQMDTRWLAVAAGDFHTLALREDGTLWAWGLNENGRLGDGTTHYWPSPQPVQPEAGWKLVVAGNGHTMALRTDGVLWAWGANPSGQLGNGNTGTQLTPVIVDTESRWQSLTAGGNHTAGLRNDGTLWSWGNNSAGQLGDETTIGRLVPAAIEPERRWQVVSAGGGSDHTVAVRDDGTLWAWGSNNFGQLGDGTTIGRSKPTLIQPETRWQSVALGFNHTVALRLDGTLWAWGRNVNGQLGDGTTSDRHRPRAIQPGVKWLTMAAGRFHTVALRDEGTLWSWGDNSDGQLGDGTSTRRLTPIAIQPEAKWKAVAAGGNRTLAIREDESLWAWGSNRYGELGDGTLTNKRTPIAIMPESRWQAVTVGSQHSMALRDDGTLWAWGNNGTGQLGIPPWRQVLGGAVWGPPEP